MKSLSTVLESVLSPGFDPKIDYTAEFQKYCNKIHHMCHVESIIYNQKTGRFDVTTKGNEGFQVFGDRIDDGEVRWDSLPYGTVTGVFEIAYVDALDIDNLPTSCGGFASYGCTFVGSKPHTCEIIDYDPGNSGIYRGYIEITKMRGSKTRFKNTGKLTFDVSRTKRVIGELKESQYGGVGTEKGCRIQPNAQKPADILKRVGLVGN